MCIVDYDIGACPYCPNQKNPVEIYNKLYLNEREINPTLKKCSQNLRGNDCYVNNWSGHPIREIWICRRNEKGRDVRVVDCCSKHRPLEGLKRFWDKDKRQLANAE